MKEVQVKEDIEQVPKVSVQVIEKRVPKQVVNYVDHVVEVPPVVIEEPTIEIPQILMMEAITENLIGSSGVQLDQFNRATHQLPITYQEAFILHARRKGSSLVWSILEDHRKL